MLCKVVTTRARKVEGKAVSSNEEVKVAQLVQAVRTMLGMSRSHMLVVLRESPTLLPSREVLSNQPKPLESWSKSDSAWRRAMTPTEPREAIKRSWVPNSSCQITATSSGATSRGNTRTG